MNLLEIVDNRDLKVKELDAITTRIKTEKRKMNEDEDQEFNKIKKEVEDLNKNIEAIRLADSKVIDAEDIKKNNKRNMNNEFNLIKRLKEARNGETIKFEERATIAAGTSASGEEFISEEKGGLIEPLRDALVLVQAGATFLTGLKGDVSIPKYSGTAALWKGENAVAVDGAGATSEVTMSPKRLTCFIDVSKTFIEQDTLNAEAMLLNDIVKAISNKLEATVFGAEAGSATQPAGLFYLVSGSTVKGAASWANVVALETAVGSANIDYTNAKYITNAAGAGKLKTAAKASNAALFVMEGGQANGYNVLVTNSILNTISGGTANYTGGTESAIAFGDWSQVVVGQWGSIDLIVDNLTQATYNNVRIVVNAQFDVVKRHDAAIAVGSIL